MSNGPAPRSRPRAETMPAVTEPPRPNGLPAASTQSPTSTWRESPNATAGSGPVACTLISATSVSSSEPMTSAGSRVPSVRRDHDLVGVTDHVVVGHDQPGRIDDEAGTGAHRLLLAIAEAAAELAAERRVTQFRRQFAQHLAAGHGLGHRDVHHRRQHALDQGREALRRRAGDGAAGHRGAGGGDESESQHREPRTSSQEMGPPGIHRVWFFPAGLRQQQMACGCGSSKNPRSITCRSGCRLRRILRPVVLRIAPPHVAPHIGPAAAPEAGEVGGDCDRPARRRQQRKL